MDYKPLTELFIQSCRELNLYSAASLTLGHYVKVSCRRFWRDDSNRPLTLQEIWKL